MVATPARVSPVPPWSVWLVKVLDLSHSPSQPMAGSWAAAWKLRLIFSDFLVGAGSGATNIAMQVTAARPSRRRALSLPPVLTSNLWFRPSFLRSCSSLTERSACRPKGGGHADLAGSEIQLVSVANLPSMTGLQQGVRLKG